MEIKHLCFAYGRTPVLTDLNFRLEEGKVTTILGPNGCGKTTLFRLLTRELFPAKGNVYIRNRNIYGLERKLNREYGMTVVMVLHDINQAIAYSHKILCMKQGRILFSGTPEEVVTRECMRELYDIDMEVLTLGRYRHVLVESPGWKEDEEGTL